MGPELFKDPSTPPGETKETEQKYVQVKGIIGGKQ